MYTYYVSTTYILCIRPWALCPMGSVHKVLESPGKGCSGVIRGTPHPGLKFVAWVASPVFGWFFDIVLVPLFSSILVPTWPQLGPQLGPQIDQESLPEPSKTHPKSRLIFDHFFDRLLIDFWTIFEPQIDQKSINKSSQQCKSQKTKC